MTLPMLIADPDTLAALRSLSAEVAAMRAALERVTMQPAPEDVSVKEAADMIRMSTDTVLRAIKAGYVEAEGEGTRRRVNVASLRAHFRRRIAAGELESKGAGKVRIR